MPAAVGWFGSEQLRLNLQLNLSQFQLDAQWSSRRLTDALRISIDSWTRGGSGILLSVLCSSKGSTQCIQNALTVVPIRPGTAEFGDLPGYTIVNGVNFVAQTQPRLCGLCGKQQRA